jgi:hypothetical protein
MRSRGVSSTRKSPRIRCSRFAQSVPWVHDGLIEVGWLVDAVVGAKSAAGHAHDEQTSRACKTPTTWKVEVVPTACLGPRWHC